MAVKDQIIKWLDNKSSDGTNATTEAIDAVWGPNAQMPDMKNRTAADFAKFRSTLADVIAKRLRDAPQDLIRAIAMEALPAKAAEVAEEMANDVK